MVLLPCAARRAPFVVSARVRRATRHSLRLTRARPAGPTRRWARTKGCAEPPSRPSPAHLPRSAREATVSGRAHLAGPAAAPPSDVGGGRGGGGGGGRGRRAARARTLRRWPRRRTRRCAVGRGGGRAAAPCVAPPAPRGGARRPPATRPGWAAHATSRGGGSGRVGVRREALPPPPPVGRRRVSSRRRGGRPATRRRPERPCTRWGGALGALELERAACGHGADFAGPGAAGRQTGRSAAAGAGERAPERGRGRRDRRRKICDIRASKRWFRDLRREHVLADFSSYKYLDRFLIPTPPLVHINQDASRSGGPMGHVR